MKNTLLVITTLIASGVASCFGATPTAPTTPTRTGSPVVRGVATTVLKTNNVSGQAVTNSVPPIARPGRETAIGQPGTTAIGEPGIAAIGQAGTIIGVGLGMTNRGRLPNSTNETAAPQLGQAGRETAIGERGAAAIGRAGTIIG